MGFIVNTIHNVVHVMPLSLEKIQGELQKRWKYPYIWYRKQNDLWDGYTNFIYSIDNWEELVSEIANTVQSKKLDKKELFYYAINRWYNFWSARAVEEIFCNLDGIQPARNQKDRLVDFMIEGIPFDHKTSVYPRKLNKPFGYAEKNKQELLYWLYNNQSHQQRNHFENRLFLIVYADNGEHWKLKAEIPLLKMAISNYVATFDIYKLNRLDFPTGKTVVSDIIWVKK